VFPDILNSSIRPRDSEVIRMNLSKFSVRFRIYLLSASLAWALIAALAGNDTAKQVIESFSTGTADALNQVEPFFVLSTFADGYCQEYAHPILSPPKHPKNEPIEKQLEGLWKVTRLTAIKVYDKGLFVLAPVLCSLILTVIVVWSLRRVEGNPWPYVLHPAATCLLILFMVAVFASAGLVCLILKYLLIGVFQVLGMSAGLVASLSVPILVIEAVRGWLENAFKVREILACRLSKVNRRRSSGLGAMKAALRREA
jgi:hypothetical protein